jgi:NAD(P)H-hydrate epimerase
MVIVTAAEMQEMDRQTITVFGIPGRVLMENAGRGATWFLLEQFSELAQKRVGVLAGRGNNGGDGTVIARYLSQRGICVTVYLLAERSKVKGDAAANLKLLDPLGVPVIELPEENAFRDHRPDLRREDLWIDAILGTGLTSTVRGYFKTVIEFVNSLDRPVFAVDIPSGLHADTGQPCGSCIRAAATATFGLAKTGHMIYPGAEYSGKLKVIDIGIPRHVIEAVGPKQFLLTAQQLRTALKPRSPSAHKGHAGHVLVVAGSPGKTGAAAMTAMSAVRCGAGLVTLGIPAGLNTVIEAQVVEAMTQPLAETPAGVLGESALEDILVMLEGKTCLALGPGLGQAAQTRKLVHALIEASPVPMVVDADGLNLIAGATDILKRRGAAMILTPHPGEMARLSGRSVAQIQGDRIEAAREFACRHEVHLVLKGARTVIAHPDGSVFVNPTGNAGMASGGMGDVLTGAVAGFLAQGYTPETASHMGVYLHGAAADSLAEKWAPWGYLATEVMAALPGEIKKLLATDPQPGPPTGGGLFET